MDTVDKLLELVLSEVAITELSLASDVVIAESEDEAFVKVTAETLIGAVTA